jgi:hypothetical protein
MQLFGGRCSDEDEVDVALVCPAQPLGDLSKVKDFEEFRKFKEAEANKDRGDGVFVRVQRQFISETFQCFFALVLLILVLGLVVLSFFYCQVCLFGIMVVSACLCPFIPYFNIPLWTSILLIVVLGMTYTQRPFTFIWK